MRDTAPAPQWQAEEDWLTRLRKQPPEARAAFARLVALVFTLVVGGLWLFVRVSTLEAPTTLVQTPPVDNTASAALGAATQEVTELWKRALQAPAAPVPGTTQEVTPSTPPPAPDERGEEPTKAPIVWEVPLPQEEAAQGEE